MERNIGTNIQKSTPKVYCANTDGVEGTRLKRDNADIVAITGTELNKTVKSGLVFPGGCMQ